MNRSKAKGTAAETAVVKWLRLNGFPGADRQPLRGNRDCGDIAVCPGIVIEVKNHSGAPALGQPTEATLMRWMAQCEAECRNAGAAMCPLVVKRAGTTDVGRWFAYLPMYAVLGSRSASGDPVCMTLSTLANLLRAYGWGNGEVR